MPKQQRDVDFSRIRHVSLSNHGKYLRQTIVSAAYPSVSFNGIFSKYCFNMSGKEVWRQSYDGLLSRVIPDVRYVLALRSPA